MTENNRRSGNCLCGSVGITATFSSLDMGACHCEMCRKWTGGVFMNVHCKADVQFSGESFITVYDSSPWAERGFCSRCGSSLFYRLKQGKGYHMPVALFDESQDLNFAIQVYIDKKPAYYSFSNETAVMTEAEIMAKYGPGSD